MHNLDIQSNLVKNSRNLKTLRNLVKKNILNLGIVKNY